MGKILEQPPRPHQPCSLELSLSGQKGTNMSLGVDLVDKCPHCGKEDVVEITSGITYNLMPIFRAAGWEDSDYDDYTGERMLPIATATLMRLRERPEYFRTLNPPNGWGTYEDALWFFERLVDACRQAPNYKIVFSR